MAEAALLKQASAVIRSGTDQGRDFLAVKTQVFPSKGEARKMTVGNGVSINKDKVTDIEYEISEKDIVDGKYILAQKGKKNYFIINII